MTPRPIAPHTKLDQYYAAEDDRAPLVNKLFDEGAEYYELVCRLMSFGTGETYRGDALRSAGLATGMRILDIATGTGLMLRSAAMVTGPEGLAIGLDPSRGMLRECRTKCAAPLIQGRGEALPFGDGSFDMVSMGYALRHVTDLVAFFDEIRRVLKPGGVVLLLEITDVPSPVGRYLLRPYLRTVIPNLANIVTGAKSAGKMMNYFWETIEHCVPPNVILEALRQSGFADAARHGTVGGFLSEYRGTARSKAD